MIIMIKLLKIFLGLSLISSVQNENLIEFWLNHNATTIEEYRQNGRICNQMPHSCHFPYYHENQLIYGCMYNPDLAGEACTGGCGPVSHVCKNSFGAFTPCYDCPLSGPRYLQLLPMKNPNGHSVILECHGYGSPNPTITIRKNGEVVEVVKPPEDTYPTFMKASITLKYEEKDYGVYSCDVDNGLGSHSSDKESRPFQKNYHFTGIELPLTPTNLRVVSVYRTYVTLEWDFEVLHTDYYCRYELVIIPGKTPETADHTKIDVRENTFKVMHLSPGVKYEFKVRRVTQYGYGLYSEPAYATIPADALLDGPVNLVITKLSAKEVSLAWNVTGDDERPHSRLQYEVECPGAKYRRSRYARGYSVTDFGLLPNAKYKFEIVTILEGNISRLSEPVYLTTSPVAPSIESVTVIDDEHNEVLIECKVAGVAPGEVSWKHKNEPLPPTALVNTTRSNCYSVISILTLRRTPLVYSEYSCLANNSLGTDTKTVTVPYKGDHPQVWLANMIIQLAEDVKIIKENQETHEELLWRIFRHV